MSDGVRPRELPDVDWKSDKSGIISSGGTKVVEAEPVPVEIVEERTLLATGAVVLWNPLETQKWTC